MTVKIIACEVMREELLAVTPTQVVEFEFISIGLHVYPEKLRVELQKLLDESRGFERVVLAFGLCGGAVKALYSLAQPLTIPRVHDCIPVLLGSKESFDHLRREETGTLYHTCGWMKGMKGVLGDKSILSDYRRICEKYGEKKTNSILKRMYDGYRRVLFIHTGHPEEETYKGRSLEIARLLNLRHDEMEGESTYIEKIVNGPYTEQDFITIAPGDSLEEDYFLTLGGESVV